MCDCMLLAACMVLLLQLYMWSPYSCAALDEIGDTSSEEERRIYFQTVDQDNSEGIDFEEFISVSCAMYCICSAV